MDTFTPCKSCGKVSSRSPCQQCMFNNINGDYELRTLELLIQISESLKRLVRLLEEENEGE